MSTDEAIKAGPPATTGAAAGSKRVVYVLIGLAHFPYHESVISALCDSGVCVDLVILKRDPKDGAGLEAADNAPVRELLRTFDDFISSHPNLRLISVNKAELTVSSNIKNIRYLRSYASYVRRFSATNFYRRRWLGYMPEELSKFAAASWMQALLKMRYTEHFLGWLDKHLKPNTRVSRKLSELNPDMVIISPGNMRYNHEVEWLKAAKKIGVRSAIVVLSWDNLTTKGLIHARPNHLFVWNEHQADEAAQIHNIPENLIFVAGAPFFDKWRHANRLSENRSAFLSSVGLDPKRKYIVYLGSSANIADNESWLIRELFNEITRSPDPSLKNIQIYVRPHPGNRKICADLIDLPVVLSPDEDAGIPFSPDRKKRLYNIISHSELAVSINTSAIIDAIAISKPCVSIKTDLYGDTHTNSAHFRHLFDAGAVVMADGPKECARIIGEHIRGADPSGNGRQLFLKKYIQSPFAGKSSGETISWITNSLINNVSPDQIHHTYDDSFDSALK